MTAAVRATERPEAAGCEVSRLADEVQGLLRGLVRELRIEATDAGLVLRGRAYSFYGKQLAQHEVMRRAGGRLAANRVQVD